MAPWKTAKAIMRNRVARAVNTAPVVISFEAATQTETTRMEEPMTRQIVPRMVMARTAW